MSSVIGATSQAYSDLLQLRQKSGIAVSQSQANIELKNLLQERDPRDSPITSSLNKSFKILADTLYQKPTHFLLELIQNADDNTYAPGVSPKLQLRLTSRSNKYYFSTDCNEIGFSYAQLNSLLQVGESTKSKITGGRKGYIGEKGIGFKSVFKVADIVHVKSGYYEFKLDRNQPLGMMRPILSQFVDVHGTENTEQSVSYSTKFCLELRNRPVFEQIQKELQCIEPQLLMFVQNLKTLHISLPETDKMFSRYSCDFDPGFGGETMTIIAQDERKNGEVTMKTKYIVQRHLVSDLPFEPQREGATTSEVVLAFPVKSSGLPISKRQKAFAFLPIDDFGFQFLIQADFLLVANRENLQYPLQWNDTLQGGIRKAFLKAVERFIAVPINNAGKSLRYAWPQYLTYDQGSSYFWLSLRINLLADLKRKPILESRDESAGFQKPDQLFYVPVSFRLGDATLFDLPSIEKSHLAFGYDDFVPQLTLIGVQRLHIDHLCQEFELWMAKGGVELIKTKSIAWHKKISSLFLNINSLKRRLKNLPIIPLRDGRWVKSSWNNLYLPTPNQQEHVPNGIDVFIVDPVAASDPYRRAFFQFLGLEQYRPEQVCKIILEMHGNKSAMQNRADEDLILDLAYLFEHRSLLYTDRIPHVWILVQASGQRQLKNSDIYFIDPDARPSLIEKYKDSEESPFHIMDPRYEKSICKDKQENVRLFRKWISRFHSVPVLVRDGRLTQEWVFLCEKDFVDLLLAVKHHWEIGNRHPTLLKAVQQLKIRRRGKLTKMLGLMALPTRDLMQKCPHLDFIPLPCPTELNWGFLSDFGLVTSCSTTAWLRELEAISHLPIKKVDKEVVHMIYKRLSDEKSSRMQSEIRRKFTEQPLVFIPKPTLMWLMPNHCVWNAPKELKAVHKLADLYTGCKALFRDNLDVKSAGLQDIVNEVCSIRDEQGQDRKTRFTELMTLLRRFCSKEGITGDQKKQIRTAKIFPIRLARDDSQSAPAIEFRSLNSQDWYIPDKAALYSAFKGKVAMLAMTPQWIHLNQDLIMKLGGENQFLSEVVETRVKPIGDCIPDLRSQESLRIRLKYISYMATRERAECEDEISRTRIWSVPSFRVTRRLSFGLHDITVQDNDEESVTIDTDDDTTNIYIREDISPSEATINFKLVEYFSEQFKIDSDDINLVNLVMTSAISSLPGLLEKHDRYIPEGADDDDSDVDNSDSVTQSTTSDEDSDGDRSQISNTETADNLHSSVPIRLRNTPLLRDLVPSHQAITEKIRQKAQEFRISESLVAGIPASLGSASSTTSTVSLPTRSQDGSPKINRTLQVASSSIAMSHGGTYSKQLVIAVDEHPAPSIPRTRSHPGPINEHLSVADIRLKEIGYRGELFVYVVLSEEIGQDWGPDNWTSKMRRDAGLDPFTRLERDFADFTYLDSQGLMMTVLRKAGVSLHAEWSNRTTYHLEVKTTLNKCDEPFHISQNQLEMMRRYHRDPDNAYILLRVFDADEDRPGIKFFPNPWNLYLQGVLDFQSPTKSYMVFQCNAGTNLD